MHELTARLAVVEETELTQSGDGLGGEVESGMVRNSSPRSRASRARSAMRSVLKATCWGSRSRNSPGVVVVQPGRLSIRRVAQTIG